MKQETKAWWAAELRPLAEKGKVEMSMREFLRIKDDHSMVDSMLQESKTPRRKVVGISFYRLPELIAWLEKPNGKPVVPQRGPQNE